MYVYDLGGLLVARGRVFERAEEIIAVRGFSEKACVGVLCLMRTSKGVAA